MKRTLGCFLLVLMSIPYLQPGGGKAAGQTTYYVSSSTGNDSNNGTSPATAWQTLFKISQATYNPGDAVLLKRGDTFEGQILDSLYGSSGSPITIGAFGSGAKPIIYGDLRGRTWIAISGRPGVYKAFLGGASEILTGFNQWVAGAWKPSVGTSYRGSNPTTWGAFLDSLGEGELGLSSGRDTLFVHTFGSVTFPTTKDSIRIYRYSIKIMAASHDYIVRDLEFRNFVIGFSGYGNNALLRNLSTLNCVNGGLRFLSATNSLMDSCFVDSTGDTGIYLVVANHCVVRYNTVTNVLQAVDGFPSSGIDLCGVGILDNYDSTQTVGGNNTVEYNTFYNIYNGFTDFFFTLGDTVRYNTGHGARSGGSPHGTNIVMMYNNFTFFPTVGNGTNISQLTNGNITYAYNTLDSVKDYGVWVSENDGSGTVSIHDNTIKMAITARFFVKYDTTRITSTNNHFYGTGDVYSSNHISYSTLPLFHAATGYENGSTPLVALSSALRQIDFGQHKLGQLKDTAAGITNQGGDTLKITAVTSTGSAFTPRPAAKNIAYGDAFADTVRFTPPSFGQFSGNIFITSNDPLGPDTISVTGSSPYPVLTLNQPSLNFGNVARNAPKPQTIQITNSSINTLTSDSIYTATSLFVVNRSSVSVPAKDSVTVTFTPVAFGSFRDTLYFRNNSATPLIKVPLSGTSPSPSLGVNQLSINFGNVGRDSSKQLTLQISNATVNTLTIDSAYTASAVFKANKKNLSVPASDSIALTFSPVSVGSFADTLYLRNNSASAMVKIPLSGNCPSPMMVTSSSGIVFPDRALQDSAVILVYARNTSISPLSISTISTATTAFAVSPKTMVVPGNDSTALRVVFKPAVFGATLDTMTISSDGGLVKLPLSGTSPFPVVNVNPSLINFGLAPANDSNYQRITVKNTSINKLRIDSGYTNNNVFIVSIHTITVADSATMLVVCYSPAVGTYNDTLYLKNNSASILVKIPIAVRVYSKPGKPQSSRISPGHWTNTTTDTVSWSVTQAGMLSTPRAWYSLDTLPRLSNTLLSQPITNNSFLLPLNKVGVHTVYFFLEDSAGNKNQDSTGFVIARYDSSAPAIQYDGTQPDTVLVQQDGSINTIPPITASSVKPAGGAGVASMSLNYRRINDDSSSSIQFPGFVHSSLTLPVSAFKSGSKTIGVDYQIQTTDSAGNTSSTGYFSFVMRLSPGAVVTNPLGIPSASAFPAAQEVKAYRIVSLPYDLDNKAPSSFMEQSFGSHSENGKPYVRWRMQRLLDSTWEDYETFKDSAVAVPGSAFFLISRDPGKSIEVSNAQLVRADAMFSQGIQLKKGWNLVGNPFFVNIPFSRLFFVGGSHLAHYYYSGSGPQGGWESSGADIDTLRAWQGWALKVDSACTMKITIAAGQVSPSARRNGIQKNAVSKTDSTKEWTLRVSASRSDIQLSYDGAELGMRIESAEGYDSNDRFDPPFVGDRNIFIGFSSEAGPLLKDMRPVNIDGDAWDMTVMTGDGEAEATLVFSGVDKIPNPNFSACLLDRAKGLAYNLKSQNSIDVITGKEGFRTYRVLVGTQAFVEKNLAGIALLPNDPQLYPNYPNPFNPSTTIRYAVPNGANRYRINLKVYNVLGQEVQTLVKDEKGPGFYEVSFDGRRLSSGVYFCRIVITGGATNYSSTKKMLLIK